jgi:hypothetical protein
MTIGGYFISGCWWLLMVIVLMTIGDYYICGYCWLLMAIGGYFIGGYWWLFHYKPLVVILLVVNDGY